MTTRPIPRLHLIGPLDVVSAEGFVEIAVAVARGGVDAVHVRLPGRPAADVLALTRAMFDHLPPEVAIVVNDRLDVALACGAAGVQLGERGLPATAARRIAGDRLLVGRSVHDVAGARQAAADGADYLLAGHVYATASHVGEAGLGLEWLAEIVAAVPVPVIAIGGITARRIAEVMATDVWGIALGREILLAGDPETAARSVRVGIDGASSLYSGGAGGPDKRRTEGTHAADRTPDDHAQPERQGHDRHGRHEPRPVAR